MAIRHTAGKAARNEFRLALRALALPAVFLFASAQAPAQEACEAAAGQTFICGATNPEDLVAVPGSNAVIASGMAEGAGFYLVDTQSAALSTLSFSARPDNATFPGCPAPPSPQTLNTHGLNLRTLANGSTRLHVVGHGAREAIEVFDVGGTAAQPVLTWIGCVPMPEGLAANSVAAFADGGMVATVLFLNNGTTFADSVAGRPTGGVFEWKPGERGFTFIEGSELAANNGIEVSADDSEMYVVSSGRQTVVAFSHSNPTRELRSTRPLPFTPDNVHMGPDGRLYTAGMANDVPECGGPPNAQHTIEILAACPRGSIAVAIDPATMRDTVVLQTDKTPLFSNATMALPVGDEYWLGTFSGNRIARVPAAE